MNNLTLTNNTETITSMEVAQMIDKEHAKLLRDIHRYINQIEKVNESKIGQSKIGFTDFFIESTYITSQNKTQPCYNITHKGCEFIANKLTGIKGTEFTARYVNRFHELEENNTVNSITTAINNMFQALITLTESMTQMQQDITSLKESSGKKAIPEKKYSRWKTNTFAKLNLLTDYANEHSDKNITLSDTLHITLNEMQDIYDIELSDYVNDYMMEYGLESKPFDLDVVQHYKNIREMYTLTVNSFMERFDLKLESKDRYKNEDRDKMNIFNELMKEKGIDK